MRLMKKKFCSIGLTFSSRAFYDYNGRQVKNVCITFHIESDNCIYVKYRHLIGFKGARSETTVHIFEGAT